MAPLTNMKSNLMPFFLKIILPIFQLSRYRFFYFFLILFGLSSCVKIEAPKISIKNISVTKVNLQQTEGYIDIIVKNPNKFPINFKVKKALVDLNEHLVGELSQDKYIKIPAGQTRHTKVFVKLENSQVLSSGLSALIGKQAKVNINLKAYYKLGFIPIPINRKFKLNYKF